MIRLVLRSFCKKETDMPMAEASSCSVSAIFSVIFLLYGFDNLFVTCEKMLVKTNTAAIYIADLDPSLFNL